MDTLSAFRASPADWRTPIADQVCASLLPYSLSILSKPVSGEPLTDKMLASYRLVGIFPSRQHLNAALDKIEPLNPRTLACHHGSVITGKIPEYIRALRENDVTGVTYYNPMRGY
jgi:hypothetical protein